MARTLERVEYSSTVFLITVSSEICFEVSGFVFGTSLHSSHICEQAAISTGDEWVGMQNCTTFSKGARSSGFIIDDMEE